MATTTRLLIETLSEAQAQKHVTVNEALRILDLIVQPVAVSNTSTPPGSPTDGTMYMVGASATGAWAGQDGDLALRINGAWVFRTPTEGWTVYDLGTGTLNVHDGTGWEVVHTTT